MNATTMPRRRWPRRLAIAFIAILVIVVGVAWWIARTSSGARFVLTRVENALAGRLTLGAVSGTLAGPLVIDDLRYRDEGVDARVSRATLDLALLDLLGRRVRVERAEIGSVIVITRTRETPATETAPESTFDLRAPIDLLIDEASIAQADVRHDDEPVLTKASLRLRAQWLSSGLSIDMLDLRADQGSVDLKGAFAGDRPFIDRATGQFEWRQGEDTWRGTLDTRREARQIKALLNVTEPLSAKLDLALDAEDLQRWQARLDIAEFDPRRLSPDTSLRAIALSADASGTAEGGQGQAKLTLDGHVIDLSPAQWQWRDRVLVLDALELASTAAPGRASMKGTIDLGAETPAFDVNLSWRDVELPADLVGQALRTQGESHVVGTTTLATIKGQFALGPEGRLSNVEIAAQYSPERIGVDTLAVVQARGRLDVAGEVRLLDGSQQWDLKASAKTFDPGAILVDWPGSLSFNADSSGSREAAGVGFGLRIENLEGQLRGREVRAEGDLNASVEGAFAGHLLASAGDSRLAIDAKPSKDLDARVRLHLADLHEWWADGAGTAEADVRVQGRWPAVAIAGEANARHLVVGEFAADVLDARIDIANLDATQGEIAITGSHWRNGQWRFDQASVNAKGEGKAHALTVDVSGDQLGARLRLRGTREDAHWREQLESLAIDYRDQGTWSLVAPVTFDYSDGAMTLGEACLSDEIARVCVAGERGVDRAGQARVQLEHLRLAWLTRLAQPDLALDAEGELAGGGAVRFDANGAAQGELQLRSNAGRVSPTGDDETTLLAYRDLQADLTLDDDRHQLHWRTQFDDGGHANADIAISGSARTLDGQVDVAMNDLAVIELLSTQFAEVSGQLRGEGRVGGTLDAPRVDGAITLEHFATELPRLGLKLREGHLRATADGDGQLQLEGQVTSGEGQLKLTSQGRVDALDALRVEIEGERFLAADIPGARVVITPKLLLERAGERLKLTGEVTIPQASIDLARLPGGGSAKLSPDVVIVDDPPRAEEAATPLSAEVTVVLGDAVKLKGYGLNGEVAGRLVVIDTPRRDTVGRGEIVINGTYKAYGQDLKIERGRLLFAGTAIDDPGLDLRAVRKLTEVTAGLSVKGTARRPELTVFSEPALEQSDAIAYLVTGRPLSALKSGESDMVGTATRALGAATGDLLAKSVGAKLGVDAGVSDEGAIGGAAFTVGKYLSPRLYLSYGVGLFTPGEVITLRYRLSKRWQLEAQSASTSTQAGIDYRIER